MGDIFVENKSSGLVCGLCMIHEPGITLAGSAHLDLRRTVIDMLLYLFN